MLIVILGGVPSLLLRTSANKAGPITGAGAEQLSGVYCDMEMDMEETLELDEFNKTVLYITAAAP